MEKVINSFHEQVNYLRYHKPVINNNIEIAIENRKVTKIILINVQIETLELPVIFHT